MTCRSVPSSNPPEILRFLARSTSSGIHCLAGPTKIAAPLADVRAPVYRRTDREGHTSLTGSSKGCSSDSVEGQILVGYNK